MIHQAKSYFQFLRQSTNKHGIHSPFVYDLTTKCFNNTTNYPEYAVFKKHRKALLSDSTEITMKDFGEGSRVFKGNTRKVSDIAKVAGLQKKRQRLLFRLCRYLNAQSMLELGTSLGMGSISMALANPENQVITVEGCKNTLLVAKKNFTPFGIKNIEAHNAVFKDFLSDLSEQKFDIIFVDGDHNGKRTLEYFEKLLNHVHNDSVIIFDDIYWNPGMTEAWKQIINHNQISVSIDTFQWGLIFFRKEQRKQHFVIRI